MNVSNECYVHFQAAFKCCCLYTVAHIHLPSSSKGISFPFAEDGLVISASSLFQCRPLHAPAVQYPTIRILLSIKAEKRMLVKQLDIKPVFFFSGISEDIDMGQSPGFERRSLCM